VFGQLQIKAKSTDIQERPTGTRPTNAVVASQPRPTAHPGKRLEQRVSTQPPVMVCLDELRAWSAVCWVANVPYIADHKMIDMWQIEDLFVMAQAG